MSETDINQKVADEICREFRWNGQTFQEGQYVALLDGNVIAAADSLDQIVKALRSVDPNPSRGMIVQVTSPQTDFIR